MKKLLTILFAQSIMLFAYAADPAMNNEKRAQGTSGVDDVYVDEIKNKESALEKSESRTETFDNTRSPSGYGHMHSKEDDQQREEELKAIEKQRNREGEADGAEYDQ